MSDCKLVATSPLGGYHKKFEGVILCEITDNDIVSIATPVGGETALAKTVKSVFKTDIPAVGEFVKTPFKDGRLLALQPGQLFLTFKHDLPNAIEVIDPRLKKVAYLTDQSDSFVQLEMSGKKARVALERICPIDLHPSVFPIGKLARTSMEHLGATIVHTAPDTFQLLSPCSSAQSFLHALEVSIHNIS